MAHLTTTNARRFDVHGVEFTSFVSSSSGSTSLAAWRADFRPRTPGHTHTMTREEVLYVVDGVLDLEINDESFAAVQGDAVLVPAGAIFRVSNNSEKAASAWVTTTLGMTATMLDSGAVLAPPWAQ
ncbi:cupin domain-containing protein [Gordonia sp. PDNC005]|uniref:cupin domain-containing protein n=1 Tax=unclassified Gordonia (in: high G+C Gram-positive bacteria) TaxID=2657482 RepID=UPI0019624F4B|nr:cupin domain-containing protein [Gordonia sp. PDNC005]QRY63225.1 cupin domain-containing protein [Gordonia sp. PDNC005]